MRFWYDTEFLEDGKTIELISIGVVAEDGSEYYAVNMQAPWEQIMKHEWLVQNVVPSLPHQHGDLLFTDSHFKTRDDIRSDLLEFFLSRATESDVELWAWYGAYDHVALCQLWGKMIDLPPFMPMWTNDLRQEVHRLKVNRNHLPEQATGKHNALEDAQHLRKMHRAVEKMGVKDV